MASEQEYGVPRTCLMFKDKIYEKCRKAQPNKTQMTEKQSLFGTEMKENIKQKHFSMIIILKMRHVS